MSRRLGILTALCFSAVLACTVPSLLSSLLGMEPSRVDASLRPEKTTTLSVWVTSDSMGDRSLLGSLFTAFEKQHPSIRIFSRFVDAEELTFPDVVLPDVVLFGLGDLTDPSTYLLPLQQECYDTGSSAGVQYAKPLWYAPWLLSIPSAWLSDEEDESTAPKVTSFFDLATKAPDANIESTPVTLALSDIPFDRMLSQNTLKVPSGIALLQLMALAPKSLQTVWLQTLQTSSPLPKEPCASVQTLSSYLSSLEKGENNKAYVLSPPMNDQLRLIGLCLENQAALTFLDYLQSKSIQEQLYCRGFLPYEPSLFSTNPILSAVQSVYEQGASFPNAFEMNEKERNSLCYDALLRGLDPIETFLHLR